MNDDIQFGELEEAPPRKNLRPDRNKHFAVAAYGSPAPGELPIFLDLDVAHDMEMHAQSDTSVELGGVLLGSQSEDENGRPFVVISDSLRASHYESTKGSFKFTHDTWSAISRQRDEFPDDLQMVGWYHTHPDWGVFLSGMDMFICDNFFNKKLDVAYVIDPCRGDRGMFQWTPGGRQRVRRTGGFYLTASRFRQAELEAYAAQLEGKVSDMPGQYTPSGYGAPVINVQAPREQPPQWQPIAVFGMLALQFGLLALIAWKMLVPASATENDEQIARLIKRMDEWVAEGERDTESRARMEAISEALAEIKGAPPDFVETRAREKEELEFLRGQEKRTMAREKELETKADTATDALKHTKNALASEIKLSKSLEDKLSAATKELKAITDKEKAEEEKGAKEVDNTIWWVIGFCGAAVLLATAVVLFLKKPGDSPAGEEFKESGEPPPQESKTEPPTAN